MSVIVKGMEAPKSCAECWFFVEGASYCQGYRDYEFGMEQEKMEFCPLIPLPSEHGELIDRDALVEGFRRAIGTFLPKDPTRHMKPEDTLKCSGWSQGLRVIQDADTIVPAERSGS